LRLGRLLVLILVTLLIGVLVAALLIQNAIEILALAGLAAHSHVGKEVGGPGRVGADEILRSAIAANKPLVATELTHLAAGLRSLCALLTATTAAAKRALRIGGRAAQSALTKRPARRASRAAAGTEVTGRGAAKSAAARGRAGALLRQREGWRN